MDESNKRDQSLNYAFVQGQLAQAEIELSKAKKELEDAGIAVPSEQRTNGIKGKIGALLPLVGLAVQVVMFVLSLQTEDKVLSHTFWVIGVLIFFLLMVFYGIKGNTPQTVENYKYWKKRVGELQARIEEFPLPEKTDN